jgi:hypothetical protein
MARGRTSLIKPPEAVIPRLAYQYLRSVTLRHEIALQASAARQGLTVEHARPPPASPLLSSE